MITCNRCGKTSAAGAMTCRSCGAPLSGRIDGGMSPRLGAQEQPGLPAWLESLRAGERPAAPVNGPTNFPATNLMGGESVPSWMNPQRPDSGDNFSSDPRLASPSSAFSNPFSDSNKIPSKGINMQSLIDEQSLPSWMREGKQSSVEPMSQSGSIPVSGTRPPNGIAASSLVQPDAMPDWMKTLQKQQPAQSSQPVMQAKPEISAGPTTPPAQGFSAKDLIDQQALPSWMKQQSASMPSVTPGVSKPPAQPNAAGFSASSLLDESSLPEWMREGARKSSALSSSQPMSPVQPSPSWQAPPSSMQAPSMSAMTNASMGKESVSASSFIDVNALPEWLRSVADQHNLGGANASQGFQASGYNAPSRVDNVRVPSRPRSEINKNESSEVAANVFASMLGVASATPQFPGQAAPFPPVQQMPMQQGTPPMSAGNFPGQTSSPGMVPPQGFGGSPYQGYAPGAPGGYPASYPGVGQNYPMGQSYPGVSPNPNSMSGMQGAMGMPGEQRAQVKPAKRRFLDVIREWFER